MLSSQLNLALALAGCHAGGLYVFPALQDAESTANGVGPLPENNTGQSVLTD